MTADTRAERETSVRRYADETMNELYHRVWNGRIHFGLWIDDADTIASAAARVPMTLARNAGINGADRVVEVGSGAARAAIDLARTFGCHVTATNHSPAHRRLAERAVRDAGLGHLISSKTADAENLPFDDDAFSAYWAQEVLVHLADKDRGFAEACRVLAPGGRIVFTEQTTRAARLADADRDRIVTRHASDDLWDRDDFVEALSRAGFRRVKAVDWSHHLARHFGALVRHIEETRYELERDCGASLVADELDNWRFAVRLATAGAIGWHMFIAHKP